MFIGGPFLFADLLRHATRSRIKRRNSIVATRSRDGSTKTYTANERQRPTPTSKGSVDLYKLRQLHQQQHRVETDPAGLYPGNLRHDGIWTNRRIPGRSLSCQD